MRTLHSTTRLRAAAALLGVLACSAGADVAEVATEDGTTMTFEYEGDKLRINMPEQQGYMLLRDQNLYMVTDNNGQLMVVDMKSAFNMFGGMAAGTTPDMVKGELISLDSTGRSETVGGIPGEVYQLKYTDHNGVQQEAELVLSEDPRAIGFRDAIAHMAITMSGTMKKGGFKEEVETGEEIQRVLEQHGKGVLRYGRDMQVQSITATSVAEERFFLPAAPTDLSAIMGGMMGGSMGGDAGSGEDGSGGYVEEKAERQQNRVEQKTDNAVDRATDNAVDKVLDKAFGKIFGN